MTAGKKKEKREKTHTAESQVNCMAAGQQNHTAVSCRG